MPATTELGSKMVAGVPVNILRGPRIIAVAGNLGDLWGEQHRIETRTKPNHSWVNSGRLMIGGNYSRSPEMNRAPIWRPILIPTLEFPGSELPWRERLDAPLLPPVRRPVAETRSFLDVGLHD